MRVRHPWTCHHCRRQIDTGECGCRPIYPIIANRETTRILCPSCSEQDLRAVAAAARAQRAAAAARPCPRCGEPMGMFTMGDRQCASCAVISPLPRWGCGCFQIAPESPPNPTDLCPLHGGPVLTNYSSTT